MELDGAAAAELRVPVGLVVGEEARLQAEVPRLPPVDVVRPLLEGAAAGLPLFPCIINNIISINIIVIPTSILLLRLVLVGEEAGGVGGDGVGGTPPVRLHGWLQSEARLEWGRRKGSQVPTNEADRICLWVHMHSHCTRPRPGFQSLPALCTNIGRGKDTLMNEGRNPILHFKFQLYLGAYA